MAGQESRSEYEPQPHAADCAQRFTTAAECTCGEADAQAEAEAGVVPYIWLQEDEESGEADCGCRLALDADGVGSRTGPAYYQCNAHDAALDLLAALEGVIEAINVGTSDSHTLRVSIDALEDARDAITKARGQ